MDIAQHSLRLSQFLESSEDGSFYVGHAFILARLNGRKYLVDCVLPRRLFIDSWVFFPDLEIDDRLFDVDGVFISHLHEDHYDLNFLSKLRPGTPIYITSGRLGFDEILNNPQFNVRQLPPMELYSVDDGVSVLAIPSDHNSFDSSFIIKGQNFSVFQGNDNFLGKDVVVRAREVAGPVDHAYVPFAYVWWYPFCLTSITAEERNAEAKRLTQHNMEIGLMMGEVLEAKLIIPSAGNLVYYESAHSVINRGIASPFDFVEFALSRSPSYAERVRPLLAGDFALKIKGQMEIHQVSLTKEAFFEKMDVFLTTLNSKEPPPPHREVIDSKVTDFLRNKLKNTPEFNFDWKLYFSRGDLPGQSVQVDLKTKAIEAVPTKPAEPNTVFFQIQPHAFEKWVDGKISFEDILNSQRFQVARYPEVFIRELWDVIRVHF